MGTRAEGARRLRSCFALTALLRFLAVLPFQAQAGSTQDSSLAPMETCSRRLVCLVRVSLSPPTADAVVKPQSGSHRHRELLPLALTLALASSFCNRTSCRAVYQEQLLDDGIAAITLNHGRLPLALSVLQYVAISDRPLITLLRALT